jgi:toxin-antitoxin system PIN domain toxin
MSETVDVNVLVYASNSDAAEHDRARLLVEHLSTGPGLVVLLWPVLMGYLRLITNGSIFARPLSPESAALSIDSLVGRPHIRTVGEIDGFWESYRHVTEGLRVRGSLVPDAHLVALMHQHGVSNIWSRDRDLRKFDGITVRDPFSDRFRTGFGSASAR